MEPCSHLAVALAMALLPLAVPRPRGSCLTHARGRTRSHAGRQGSRFLRYKQ